MECIVQNFKKSIHESNFTKEQISIILDFYVSKSLSSASSQSRKLEEYGHKRLPFKEMMEIATIKEDDVSYFTTDSVQQILAKCDLQICGENGKPIPINIDTPRIALFMKSVDEMEKQQHKFGSGRAKCLLTRIRNAFAHARTYFFDNGNMLLEDELGNKTTGMILIKQKTLLDWITIIDKERKFYKF